MPSDRPLSLACAYQYFTRASSYTTRYLACSYTSILLQAARDVAADISRCLACSYTSILQQAARDAAAAEHTGDVGRYGARAHMGSQRAAAGKLAMYYVFS